MLHDQKLDPIDLPMPAPQPTPLPIPSAPEVVMPILHAPVPVAAATQPKHTASLDELVLAIISEHTGYPRDILAPNMDLEADLGIDSIKRVQILAAVAEKRPDLPVIEAPAMAGIRTIGAIIAFLNKDESKPATSMTGVTRIGLIETEAPEVEHGSAAIVAGAKLAIVGCSDGIGLALASQLQSHGIDARVSGDIPGDTEGTVYLDFEAKDDSDGHIATYAQRAFAAAKSFASSKGVQGGSLFMVQARGSAWHGGMSGLARTLALEYPGCMTRTIEVETGPRSAAEIAGAIAKEILSGNTGDALFVDASGRRTIWRETELPLNGNSDPSLLAGRPVLVVSGGARGVMSSCLTALAKVAPLRAALLGRTPLTPEPAEVTGVETADAIKAALFSAAKSRGESPTPRELASLTRLILSNREIARTLESLQKLGSETMYVAADVTDSAATEAAMIEVRKRWQQIDILIHAAGVLADKRIADKTPEQFMQVYGPKVLGLRSLLSATKDDPLRFICLFSSVAGRYGNAGQADYAMANAAMNQIAREEASRRSSRCIVRSLNWGPWDGGMVTPELRELFASKGVPVMPVTDGVAAFVRELHHPSHDPADVDVVVAARSKT